MKKRVLIYTSSFPYSKYNEWKFQEFKLLSQYFDIEILPFSFGEANSKLIHTCNDLGITIHKPFFNNSPTQINKYTSIKLIGKLIFELEFNYLKEALDNKVFTNKNKLIELLIIYKRFIEIKQRINTINLEKYDLHYFYWGTGSLELIAPILINLKQSYIIRLHGFDLYEERRLSHYFPFRKLLFKHAKKLITISKKGAEYIESKAWADSNKLLINKLGTIIYNEVNAVFGSNEKIELVSCAYLVPVKRIHLILQFLKDSDFDLHFTHIGDGPLLKELKELAFKLKIQHKCTFLGYLNQKEIHALYKEKNFDFFINVSESEGIPVSIMEAFAHYIPAIATDVGGTKELVINGENGYLLDKNFSFCDLKNVIKEYIGLDLSKKLKLKSKAMEVVNREYNLHANSSRFIKELKLIVE